MKPLLSVVMPTYNGERFLALALESVRQQWDETIEIVAVDDGSTDRTLEIIEDFSKLLPIRLIARSRVGNWVAGTNVGLREARGEWACFLHQDDFWLPGRVARLRDAMERSEGVLVVHNALFVGPDGERLGRWTCPFTDGWVPPDQFVEHLLVQNFVAIASPVFRRSAAIDSGGLDESLWFAADWDLWLRLGARAAVRFVSEILSAFRIHPASQTVARKLRPNEWEEQLTTVLERHLRNWPVPRTVRDPVEKAAMASIAVNSALSAISRGEPTRSAPLILELLALGPFGWHRYLRDSRIMQRIGSRLKVQRLIRFQRQVEGGPPQSC